MGLLRICKIFCHQVTGENIRCKSVDDGHTVVAVIGRVAVGHYIIGRIGIDAVADALAVSCGFDEVGIVVRFQESADQVTSPDAAQSDHIVKRIQRLQLAVGHLALR